MPAIQLPDGSYFPLQAGETYEEGIAAARKKYPNAFPVDTSKAQEGFVPSLAQGARQYGQGIAQLLGMAGGVSGESLRDAAVRDAAIEAAKVKTTTLEDVEKAYKEKGALRGAGALVDLWKESIAGSLPAMGGIMAGARVGALGGSAIAPLLGPAAPAAPAIGGILGGFAGAMPAQTQQMVSQQAEAHPEAPIEKGAALAGAAGASALDVAEQFLLFGRQLGFGKVASESIAKLLGKGNQEMADRVLLRKSQEAIAKQAQQGFGAAVAKGVGRGIVTEVPVEVAQQVIQRAQAGQDLTGPDAMKEYYQTAVAMVGPGAVFGGVGGVHARESAYAQMGKIQQDALQHDAALEAKAAADKEAEELQRPAPELSPTGAETQYRLFDVPVSALPVREDLGKLFSRIKEIEAAAEKAEQEGHPEAAQPLREEASKLRNDYRRKQAELEQQSVAAEEAAKESPDVRTRNVLEAHVADLHEQTRQALIAKNLPLSQDLYAKYEQAKAVLDGLPSPQKAVNTVALEKQLANAVDPNNQDIEKGLRVLRKLQTVAPVDRVEDQQPGLLGGVPTLQESRNAQFAEATQQEQAHMGYRPSPQQAEPMLEQLRVVEEQRAAERERAVAKAQAEAVNAIGPNRRDLAYGLRQELLQQPFLGSGYSEEALYGEDVQGMGSKEKRKRLEASAATQNRLHEKNELDRRKAALENEIAASSAREKGYTERLRNFGNVPERDLVQKAGQLGLAPEPMGYFPEKRRQVLEAERRDLLGKVQQEQQTQGEAEHQLKGVQKRLSDLGRIKPAKDRTHPPSAGILSLLRRGIVTPDAIKLLGLNLEPREYRVGVWADAQAVLPAVHSRIDALRREHRNNYVPEEELLDRKGKLTPEAIRFIQAEGTLLELYKLQEVTAAAIQDARPAERRLESMSKEGAGTELSPSDYEAAVVEAENKRQEALGAWSDGMTRLLSGRWIGPTGRGVAQIKKGTNSLRELVHHIDDRMMGVINATLERVAAARSQTGKLPITDDVRARISGRIGRLLKSQRQQALEEVREHVLRVREGEVTDKVSPLLTETGTLKRAPATEKALNKIASDAENATTYSTSAIPSNRYYDTRVPPPFELSGKPKEEAAPTGNDGVREFALRRVEEALRTEGLRHDIQLALNDAADILAKNKGTPELAHAAQEQADRVLHGLDNQGPAMDDAKWFRLYQVAMRQPTGGYAHRALERMDRMTAPTGLSRLQQLLVQEKGLQLEGGQPELFETPAEQKQAQLRATLIGRTEEVARGKFGHVPAATLINKIAKIGTAVDKAEALLKKGDAASQKNAERMLDVLNSQLADIAHKLETAELETSARPPMEVEAEGKRELAAVRARLDAVRGTASVVATREQPLIAARTAALKEYLKTEPVNALRSIVRAFKKRYDAIKDTAAKAREELLRAVYEAETTLKRSITDTIAKRREDLADALVSYNDNLAELDADIAGIVTAVHLKEDEIDKQFKFADWITEPRLQEQVKAEAAGVRKELEALRTLLQKKEAERGAVFPASSTAQKAAVDEHSRAKDAMKLLLARAKEQKKYGPARLATLKENGLFVTPEKLAEGRQAVRTTLRKMLASRGTVAGEATMQLLGNASVPNQETILGRTLQEDLASSEAVQQARAALSAAKIAAGLNPTKATAGALKVGKAKYENSKKNADSARSQLDKTLAAWRQRATITDVTQQPSRKVSVLAGEKKAEAELKRAQEALATAKKEGQPEEELTQLQAAVDEIERRIAEEDYDVGTADMSGLKKRGAVLSRAIRRFNQIIEASTNPLVRQRAEQRRSALIEERDRITRTVVGKQKVAQHGKAVPSKTAPEFEESEYITIGTGKFEKRVPLSHPSVEALRAGLPAMHRKAQIELARAEAELGALKERAKSKPVWPKQLDDSKKRVANAQAEVARLEANAKTLDVTLLRESGKEALSKAQRAVRAAEAAVAKTTGEAHVKAQKALRKAKQELEQADPETAAKRAAIAEGRPRNYSKQALKTGVPRETWNIPETGITITKDEDGGAYRTRADNRGGVDQRLANKWASKVRDILDGKGIKFKYLPTFEDAPEGVKISKDDLGYISPDGTVYVVGGNHTNMEDLENTLTHELVGHYGPDVILGKEGFGKLSDKVWANGEKGVRELARELGIEPQIEGILNGAKALKQNEAQTRLAVTRELVADTATYNMPSKEGVLARFRKWIVSAFRDFFGITAPHLKTTQEIFDLLRQSEKLFNSGKVGNYVSPSIIGAYRTKALSPQSEAISNASRWLMSRQEPLKRSKMAEYGLWFEGSFLDRFAPVSKALRRGLDRLVEKGVVDPKWANYEWVQKMSWIRAYQDIMHHVSDILSNGPKTIISGPNAASKTGKEYTYGRKGTRGPSMRDVIEPLRNKFASMDEAEEAATTYLVLQRAKNPGIGWAKVKADLVHNDEEHEKFKKDMRAFEQTLTPEQAAALQEMNKRYQQYNKGLLEMLAATGTISKAQLAKLIAAGDYVPFYRVNPKDKNELGIRVGDEPFVRIGDITHMPEMHRLIGGDQKIKGFFESAIQNTRLLTDMALRNQATKEMAMALQNTGLAEIHRTYGPKNPNAVRFNIEPENSNDDGKRHIIVDTESIGIPTDLVGHGLRGIATQLPAAWKLLGMPSSILRKFVTRSPTYAVRQLYNDLPSLLYTSGANPNLKNVVENLITTFTGSNEGVKRLQELGLLGGNVYTGTPEDMERITRDIVGTDPGKWSWQRLMAKLDEAGIKADAFSRMHIFQSLRQQGLSEMEAALAAREALDFSRRGVSPSLYMLASAVPFMNTQIQSLYALGKAMTGNMPFEETLRIRQKFLQRGALLAAATVAYAMSMEDDEAYKNANPRERYYYWFVNVPGLDEPLRVRIPFEAGVMFKAIPEALYQVGKGTESGKAAAKGLGMVATQSSPFGWPPLIAAGVEGVTGVSLFTGKPIEDARLQKLAPEERYKVNTTEAAKLLGQATGVSPLHIENFIGKFTGNIGPALLSLMNPALRSMRDEAPGPIEGRPSTTPLVGSLFQPKDAPGSINSAYEAVREWEMHAATFKHFTDAGQKEKAKEYAEKYAREIMLGRTGGAGPKFVTEMNKLTKIQRAIENAPEQTISPEKKRELLDKLRQQQIRLSEGLRKKTDSQSLSF